VAILMAVVFLGVVLLHRRRKPGLCQTGTTIDGLFEKTEIQMIVPNIGVRHILKGV